MSQHAQLKVTSGPDRGKVFELNDELVHIGGGRDNQVALTDQLVSEHQASIVNRDGRYAIYTPLDQGVEIDGNTIPREKWVWLPDSARITVSKKTAFQFSHLPGTEARQAASGPADANATPAVKTKASRKPAARRTTARGRKKSERPVARFITDSSGDTLVKLGEDGHLPELHLAEGPSRKTTEKPKSGSSPLVLYGILAGSVLTSMLLLVVDFEPSVRTEQEVARARREIVEFYGNDDGNLKPYQIHLRQARLAHSRGDYQAEREAYRKVLDLLNAEDVRQSFGGVTGDREKRDRRLRELVTTLYSSTQ